MKSNNIIRSKGDKFLISIASDSMKDKIKNVVGYRRHQALD